VNPPRVLYIAETPGATMERPDLDKRQKENDKTTAHLVWQTKELVKHYLDQEEKKRLRGLNGRPKKLR